MFWCTENVLKEKQAKWNLGQKWMFYAVDSHTLLCRFLVPFRKLSMIGTLLLRGNVSHKFGPKYLTVSKVERFNSIHNDTTSSKKRSCIAKQWIALNRFRYEPSDQGILPSSSLISACMWIFPRDSQKNWHTEWMEHNQNPKRMCLWKSIQQVDDLVVSQDIPQLSENEA